MSMSHFPINSSASKEAVDALEKAMDEYQSACFDYLNTSAFTDKTPARLRIQAARESIRLAALRAVPDSQIGAADEGLDLEAIRGRWDSLTPVGDMDSSRVRAEVRRLITEVERLRRSPLSIRDEVATGPLAWMVVRESHDPPEFFLTAAEAQDNACLGIADTRVIPLGRIPAPPGATPRAETEKEPHA